MSATTENKRPQNAELLHLSMTHFIQVECERCENALEIIATPMPVPGRSTIIVAPCSHCVADAEGAGWYGRQMHELPPVGDPGNPGTAHGGPHED